MGIVKPYGMKKLLLSPLALLFIYNFSFAQTTAMDFTKNDCTSGVTHTLFADLDSGYTIIQAFDMIPNCQLCIDAATELQIIRDNYTQSNPGMVRWYTTGYLDSYSCSGMTSWATSHGFTPDAEFDQGANEVAYYGGMGMPTIVVLGGTDHHVFYKHLGYSASQIDDIEAAINASISAITSAPVLQLQEFTVNMFPNPVKDNFTIQLGLNESSSLRIEIVSLSGQLVQSVFNGSATSGNFTKSVNASLLTAGMYLLKTTVNGAITYSKVCIVN